MLFPKDVLQLPRHPSQLYQFALEGVVLFIIIFWFTRKQRPSYAAGSLFILCYGCFRFLVEFVREPDSHIGIDSLGWMTRGQELSIPMILIGGGLLIWTYSRSVAKDGK
jgi:phosphatidylglycerol:prolipoprotein diacylglycerol transferase